MNRRAFLFMFPALAVLKKMVQKPKDWIFRVIRIRKTKELTFGGKDYRAYEFEMEIEVQDEYKKYFDKL